MTEHRRSFATFCHEGVNTPPQLATIDDGGGGIVKENNLEWRCAAVVGGLEGRCSHCFPSVYAWWSFTGVDFARTRRLIISTNTEKPIEK